MEIPPGQRKFECEHCQAEILVPIDLPPTSAPCPVCQEITTSPGPESVAAASIPVGQEAAPRAEHVVPEQVQDSTIKNDSEPSDDRELESNDYESRGTKNEKGGLLLPLAGLAFLGLLVGGFFLFKSFRAENNSEQTSPVGDGVSKKVQKTSTPGVFAGNDSPQTRVLTEFLAATSAEERAKFVIGKESVIPEMEAFYRKIGVGEEELKAQFFSQIPLDESDIARGIALFRFERPKQFKLSSFFTPIRGLRAGIGLSKSSLNTRAAGHISNFEVEADRAMVYFKEIDGESLLDWHTYVQTRYRTFRDFVNKPVAGAQGVFRVMVGEHASTLYSSDPSVRNYMVADPVHFEEDLVVMTLKKASEVGQLFEKLAWTDVLQKGFAPVGATLSLKWTSGAEPVLYIEKVICWEFLGVGGDPSNLSR